jgi:hypothetical protein
MISSPRLSFSPLSRVGVRSRSAQKSTHVSSGGMGSAVILQGFEQGSATGHTQGEGVLLYSASVMQVVAVDQFGASAAEIGSVRR